MTFIPLQSEGLLSGTVSFQAALPSEAFSIQFLKIRLRPNSTQAVAGLIIFELLVNSTLVDLRSAFVPTSNTAPSLPVVSYDLMIYDQADLQEVGKPGDVISFSISTPMLTGGVDISFLASL
jgi:hypothetical protein